MYLAVCTRPDISHAVGVLARHMSAPTEAHWSAARTVLRYLKGTISFGVTFEVTESSSLEFLGYCDSDYAGDLDTRRFTTCYVFLLYGGAVSWMSK